MPAEAITFQSEKSNLANTRFVRSPIPEAGPGEVLVRVAQFALTANNITYGVAGDSIGYWQFFPGADGYGCIPVWGFGDIVTSNHPDLATGTRIYGYFPMSTHLVIQPQNVTPQGFVDGVAHRAELPAVYNQYSLTKADPAYRVDLEPEQMLYRPLFTTAFLLDDFLADNDFFDAGTVILTSASSKTSIGLAYLLAQRPAGSCRVIGLTSPANRDFVESLGCYDLVVCYADAAELPREPSVMVDMAGSGRVRAAVHGALEDLLRYSCAVGATHWEDATVGGGQGELPGPRPTMFFAPSQGQKRIKDWGRQGYEARLAEAWGGFLSAAQGWISVERCDGETALAHIYAQFIGGTADPAKGYVAAL